MTTEKNPTERSPYEPASERHVVAGDEVVESDLYCGNCNAQIVVGGLAASTEVRCGGCGAQFGLDTLIGEHAPRNTKATLSAVLGLLSFFGLFLTGIPAVLLGLGALRDVRERKTLVGRRRAITGIAAGGVFGLFCSCSVSLLAILIPQFIPSKNPADIARLRKEIGAFELPQGIEVDEVQDAFSVQHFRAEDPADTTLIWLTLANKRYSPTESTARAQFIGLRMATGELQPQAVHEFEVFGQTIEVKEERGNFRGTDVRVFTGLVEREKDWMIIVIRSELEPAGGTGKDLRVPMDAEDVRVFLKSFQLPGEDAE